MSYAGSGGDDQSEDGELRHSPTESKKADDVLDFSFSDEDADTADSLDIKPPQASRPTHSAKGKRRDKAREGRSRHGHSDRRRDPDRVHGHREKHHRERSLRERELRYEHREKEHMRERESYRSKEVYRERYSDPTMTYKEHRGERRVRDSGKSLADQALDDLRERLLDKRRSKEDVQHERRRRPEPLEDADSYVRDIIDLSSAEESAPAERRSRTDRERERERERTEQEQRRERLLEAEREIERQKEQYRAERERRHRQRLERQRAKRPAEPVGPEPSEARDAGPKRRRRRLSAELSRYNNKDLSVVAVSDGSGSDSDEAGRSDAAAGPAASADDSDGDSSSARSDSEDARSEPRAPCSDASSSRSRSASRSRSRSASGSASPASADAADDDVAVDDDADDDVEADDADAAGAHDPDLAPQQQPQQPAQGPDGADRSPGAGGDPEAAAGAAAAAHAGLPPYFPAIQGCRSVEEFQCLNRIEEGTYGVVYRARDKRTEEIVALKRLKMEKEKEGFPITSLREINTLLKGQHPHIVTVREIVVGSNMDKIFIVMDYVEHDLKSLMETMRHKKQVFVPGEVKCLLRQLLGAVAHLHDNWILHRDLKTSNLLLSHKGILKVGDFGLAREYGSPLKPYTPVVVTLWYRAPELLLCAREYSTPIDMWSVGCILAELLLMNALFPGKSEVDQLNRIFKDLGTPNDKIWPGYGDLPAVKKMKFAEYPVSQIRSRFPMLSELGRDLLQRFLTYDPAQRISAEDALRHAYFTEAPLPIDPAMFPTWPAKSELGHRKALAASPKPPSGGREYKQLGDGDDDSAIGFHMGGASATTSLLEARRLAMGAGFSLKF